jgi:hypothetical protein
MKHWAIKLLVILLLLLVNRLSRADCAVGQSIQQAQASYAQGEQFELSGQPWLAVNAFHKAQDYVCGRPGNTVAPQAIKKAAHIAKQQAELAIAQGNLFNDSVTAPGAFQWFEQGLLFSEADKTLVAALKKSVHNLDVVDFALRHFNERSENYFVANHVTVINTLGAYKPDADLVAFVRHLPAENIQYLLASYAETLPQKYLEGLADLERRRIKVNPLDMLAVDKIQHLSMKFFQRWKTNRLDDATHLFDLASDWLQLVFDPRQQTEIQQRILQARLAHADHLLMQYAEIPPLLEHVISVYMRTNQSSKLQQAKQMANKQAEQAIANAQFNLARRFYELAGNEQKAGLAQQQYDQQNQQFVEQMAAIYSNQAADMQKRWSDPELIQSMQQQAQQLQQNLLKDKVQSQQKRSAQQQLEQELGL